MQWEDAIQPDLHAAAAALLQSGDDFTVLPDKHLPSGEKLTVYRELLGFAKVIEPVA